MSQQDQFDRIVSTLHDAALADSLWPGAFELVNEAVGTLGSHLLILSGQTQANLAVLFERSHYLDPSDELVDKVYSQRYFPHDERIPRFLRLSDSHVATSPRSTLPGNYAPPRPIMNYCVTLMVARV